MARVPKRDSSRQPNSRRREQSYTNRIWYNTMSYTDVESTLWIHEKSLISWCCCQGESQTGRIFKDAFIKWSTIKELKAKTIVMESDSSEATVEEASPSFAES